MILQAYPGGIRRRWSRCRTELVVGLLFPLAIHDVQVRKSGRSGTQIPADPDPNSYELLQHYLQFDVRFLQFPIISPRRHEAELK